MEMTFNPIFFSRADWIKGHYTWKCMACEYRTKTFKDFIENVETLDDENEYDDEYY